MDSDRIKGIANQAEGTIKQTVGNLTDNPKLEAEGTVRKTEGTI
jgi:uncharacterized protein YjbJ (UPF0337 family)